MLSAENLMASIVFILLVIIFWEIGRNIVKKVARRLGLIFPRSSSSVYIQDQQFRQVRTEFLRDLRQETSAMMGQGHVATMLIKDRILKQTRDEAREILLEARNEIEQMRMEAVHIVQKDVAEKILSLNQHLPRNFTSYVQGSSKQRAIEKYLDNCRSLKKKSSQTSALSRLR